MATALNTAVSSAVPIWSDGQNVEGSVATPEWSGPINTDHSGSNTAIEYQGSPEGPIPGTSSTVLYEQAPYFEDLPGNPYDDMGQVYGHAAPIADFDSNAGDWHGSGPIAQEVHEFDTGGYNRKTLIEMPKVGSWWRRTQTGQTYNLQAQVTDNAGWRVNAPNGRIDFNQDQGHNADAYDPYWIPYSERPIYLNVAHEPVPIGTNQNQTAYTPQLDLSPVGPLYWTDQSTVYETPADPQTVSQADQSQAQSSSPLELLGWS